MSIKLLQEKNYQKGSLLVLLLVYAGVFLALLTAFVGSIFAQRQFIEQQFLSQNALHIAEAGLEYYKWFLAHNPGDITHGTGGSGPFTFSFSDPEGGDIGEYEIDVSGVEWCGEVGMIDITSTGRHFDGGRERTVYGRYARPSIAEYSFIINSNVWAGFNLDITGPYHSNGIIRMSATNNSIVTSQQDTWECDDSVLTCDGAEDDGVTISTGDEIGGIYGEGPNRSLWTYPSPPINFTNILVNLAEMENLASTQGGLVLPNSGTFGYRIFLNNNNTVTVRRVTGTVAHNEYSSEVGAWYTARNIPSSLGPPTTYTLDSSCPVLFVRDKIWISGEIDRKLTVAAADPSNPSFRPSVILQDNITYNSSEAGLLLLGEEDVLLGVNVPNDMEVNGIFVAQNGKFGRNHYWSLPSGYASYRLRDSITINGTVVSNGRVGTQWVNASGDALSGFLDRVSDYDRDLVENPPPLTPRTSDTYRFIEWREIF